MNASPSCTIYASLGLKPVKYIFYELCLINDLGKVLGANPNLTHLELFRDAPSGVSFSTIFGYIPASSPLKLEHLGICNISSSEDMDLRAIIPHIRSLTSIHLAYRYTILGYLGYCIPSVYSHQSSEQRWIMCPGISFTISTTTQELLVFLSPGLGSR